jgi:hypothetical protein
VDAKFRSPLEQVAGHSPQLQLDPASFSALPSMLEAGRSSFLRAEAHVATAQMLGIGMRT